MKTDFTYNLQRSMIDWGRNFRDDNENRLTNIDNTDYSEIGRLKSENKQLKQQVQDQKEIIETASKCITSSNLDKFSEYGSLFHQKLNQYKQKYQ